MAGVAQSMMACSMSTSARGFKGAALNTTFGTPNGKSPRTVVMVPRISAVKAPEECNDEECAPTKEVGKLSMEWKAEENTKVTGTYPPLARSERKWTGYVEKDTAGQTNIYAVEPTVYVAESGISTGNAGGSEKGSDESLAVAVGLGLIAVAGASSVLLSVGKNAPAPMAASTYSGPPLSYYVAKFSNAAAPPVAAVPKSPPLSGDSSLSKPEVAVGESEPLAAAVAATEPMTAAATDAVSQPLAAVSDAVGTVAPPAAAE